MKIGILNNHSKEELLIKVTCLFWIIAKVISYKLWLSDRVFPTIPPFQFSPQLSNSIHLFLFVSSLLGLFLAFVFTKKNGLVILVVVTEMATCLLDQMRWQPWEYQCLLGFMFFIFYKRDTNQFLDLMAILLSVTYMYSGLHKPRLRNREKL